MFYLLLAIISSCLISIILKCANDKIDNNISMYVSNYLVCALLSFVFLDKTTIFNYDLDYRFALNLGLISGVLYLLSFVLYKINIEKNGMVLSTTFMKLGVIIPTLMAIIAFKERPTTAQVIGIVLVVIAIIIINYKKDKLDYKTFSYLLIILLIGSGVCDSMSNIYDKLGNVIYKDNYLFFTFTSALICTIVVCIVKKYKITKNDIVYGILIGIPNYFSSYFMLSALRSVKAIIAFPVYSVGTIILVSLIGILLFKEKLDKQKLIGMFVVLVSLILLNV